MEAFGSPCYSLFFSFSVLLEGEGGRAGKGKKRGREGGGEVREDSGKKRGATYHLRIGNHARLNHHDGLDAKRRRAPQAKIGQLAHLDAPNQVRHAVRNGRVDGILCDIPAHAEVVGVRPVVLGQPAALQLILMRRVPGPQHHLATPSHCLRVAAHHGDGAQVVQHVFCRNRLRADAGFGKGDVFGDVAR